MGRPKSKVCAHDAEKGGGGDLLRGETTKEGEEWHLEHDDGDLEVDSTVLLNHMEEMNGLLQKRGGRMKRRLENVDSEEGEPQAVESELEHQSLDEDGLMPPKKRISHGDTTVVGDTQVVILAKRLKMSESEAAHWKPAGDENNTFFYQPPQVCLEQPIGYSGRDTKTRQKLFTFRSGLPKLANHPNAENGLQFGFHSSGPLVDDLHFESGLPKELQKRLELAQSANTEAAVLEKASLVDRAHSSQVPHLTSMTIPSPTSLGTDHQTSRGGHVWPETSGHLGGHASSTSRLSQQESTPVVGTSPLQQNSFFITEYPSGTPAALDSSHQPHSPKTVPTTFSFVNIDMEFLLSPKKVTSNVLHSSDGGSTSDIRPAQSDLQASLPKLRTTSPFGVTRGRRKSSIWSHFALQNDHKYACRFCKSTTVFSSSVTTRTLKKHIISYHPDVAAVEPCLQEAIPHDSSPGFSDISQGSAVPSSSTSADNLASSRFARSTSHSSSSTLASQPLSGSLSSKSGLCSGSRSESVLLHSPHHAPQYHSILGTTDQCEAESDPIDDVHRDDEGNGPGDEQPLLGDQHGVLQPDDGLDVAEEGLGREHYPQHQLPRHHHPSHSLNDELPQLQHLHHRHHHQDE